MRRLVIYLVLLTLVLAGDALAGLLPTFIERGTVNLRPQQCIAPHDVAVWKDKVIVTGASTTGAGPNIWELNISNPASPYFLSSSGVGYKAYGEKASAYGKVYAASWFSGLRIFDVNTNTITPVGLWDTPDGALWDLDVEGNRAYMAQGTETTSSIHAIDISNPAAPSQVFSFDVDEGVRGIAATGSYLYFVRTHYSGNPWFVDSRLVTYNISDESNPYQTSVLYSRHPLGELVQRGDYLYTTWGEGGWAFYDGSVLPTDNYIAYALHDGSQSYASIVGGPTPPDGNLALRVYDNSTSAGSLIHWYSNWQVDDQGGTVVARARCASAGGSTSSITNIECDDGNYKLSFRILTDRIVAIETSQTHYLDATQWHIYRVTLRNGHFKLYVDEAHTPVMTGATTEEAFQSKLIWGGGADAATQDIYFDYLDFIPWDELPPNCNGGVDIFDISDRTTPVLVGECYSIGSGGAFLMGNYLFSTTSGNGYLAHDISNPLSPFLVRQDDFSVYGLELAIAGKGKYLYVGDLCGDWEGWLKTVEAFDKDPDATPPARWGDFTYAEASWNTEYLADVLPTVSSPAWTVPSGYTESMAGVSDGLLRVNDNLSTAKTLWVRNWDATSTRGGTVLFRARCDSYDLNGGAVGNMNNVILEDGKYKTSFTVLTDRIRNVESGAEYALDGTQWHTYRITMKGPSYALYVDEAAAPALAGALISTTNRARVWFGSSSTLSFQDIYFDYLQCYSEGVSGPSARIADQTPDVSVSVQDWVDNDSVSGLDPATAQCYWSIDGGVTWLPNGWDCQYESNQLPAGASPAWTVAEGSESYASVNSGVLHVVDNSTASGSKIKWSRSWGAIPSVGTTVLVRAKCNSTGPDTTYTRNIFVEDGAHVEEIKILTNCIVAANANITYALDGTQWHTYRVTTRNTSFNVYVDEDPTPVITGTLSAASTNNRVMFGSGASGGTQDIELDFVYYTSQGDVAPGQSGGAGQPASCTGQPGDPTAVITATSVPFGQYSETLNKVRFSIRDVAGSIGYSPMYNVRIAADAGPRVLNVTSSAQNKTYTTGGFIDARVQFDVPVYVTGGSPQMELETGTTNRRATYSGGSGTTILQFSYTVQSGDATPDLDYTSANAIALNGATIQDQYFSNADLRLPQPGATGSLSYNKDIAVDAVRPYVTSVTSDKPDGHYKAGEVIDVLLNLSEVINVTGTPLLELETGSVDHTASYVTGSGTATLSFRYTVQPGDASDDLNYKSIGSLTSSGATIRDIAGNYATLTLPAPDSGASLASNKDLAIDTSVPGATSVDPAGGVYNEPTDVTLTATDPGVIYYTTDGSEPTMESAVYTAPIHLVNDTVLRFFAADLAGNEESPKKQETYTILTDNGSIAAVKDVGIGDPVRLGGKALYLKQGAVGYIEETNRSAGIRVEGTISADAGELVNLTGTRQVTTFGESFVQIGAITPDGLHSLLPLCMNNAAAKRVLAEGLWVRIWGIVSSVGDNAYVLSDGSGGNGIMVITQGAPGVINGQPVVVEGAASRGGGRTIIKL